MPSTPPTITAVSPGKAILFGEHAINRGQPALSAAVGLYARCTVARRTDGQYRFGGGGHRQSATPESIAEVGRHLDDCRKREAYDGIRTVARADYFGPQKYVLYGMFGQALPRDGMDLLWESDVPPHSGLGSGGSAFTAMVAAVSAMFVPDAGVVDRSDWAHRGDVIAHGGVASALDSQTSLHGGVIRFTGAVPAEQVTVAPGLDLVVANCGVGAPTGEVNARVRQWLGERPHSRMAYFKTIGALARNAEAQLAAGNWDELGRLMTLNQLVLEKIGVSVPATDRLIDAALGAGAYGAKVSGSGGGGIVIALVGPETKQGVMAALTDAGGTVLAPRIAVEGTRLLVD